LAKSKFVTAGVFSDDEEAENNDEAMDDDENSENEEGKDGAKEGKNETKENDVANEDEEKKKKLDMRNQLKEQLLELDYGVYKKGRYVRIEIEGIKYKHFKNFRYDFPIILCRINPAEDTFGFLKVTCYFFL